ncbi:MAG: hypothetical protein AB8B63_05625 [Granulosicoccus sp.]
MNNPYSNSPDAEGPGLVLAEIFRGLQPAFRHARTGESHLSQLVEGVPAEVYGFAGLPDEWIVERDKYGNPTALHHEVIAGYWRDARFIALEEVTILPLDS